MEYKLTHCRNDCNVPAPIYKYILSKTSWYIGISIEVSLLKAYFSPVFLFVYVFILNSFFSTPFFERHMLIISKFTKC